MRLALPKTHLFHLVNVDLDKVKTGRPDACSVAVATDVVVLLCLQFITRAWRDGSFSRQVERKCHYL